MVSADDRLCDRTPCRTSWSSTSPGPSPGPHATMMLGDLGARVIKVEAPGPGDDTRGWGPPFVGDPRTTGSRPTSCRPTATRSRSPSTSRPPTTATLLLRLVDRADVLVENFRTGVLERLGLGIEALQERNPRLVVLSITGFGHDGPEGGRAGYDQIAQGEAGLMSLTGSGPDDPQRVGVPIADLLPACTARTASSPRCTSASAPARHGGADLAAGRGRRRARVPGHPVDRGRRGRPGAGQPPPVDRALRPLPLPRRCRADRARQRGAVAAVLRGLRARPRRRGPGHQRRAGRARATG